MFPQFQATRRYELLEIQIPTNSTATRFNVPDQPQLRSDQDADIIIQGIETFDITGVTLSPNNLAVATLANLLQTYLTLYVEGEESLYRIPLIQLKRIANEGATSPYQWNLQKFKNVQVDWTKSYFFTPAAYGGGVFTTFSFLLGVHYEKLPANVMAN